MGSHRPSVLFDASPLRYRYTGLGQFTYHLARSLAAMDAGLDLNFMLHEESKHLLNDLTDRFVVANWFRRRAPSSLQPMLFSKYNLWHITAENSQFNGISKSSALLFTIHGLHFLDEDPTEMAERKLKHVQQLVDKSSALATVSSFTEGLVRKHLDVGNKPIKVIPHGVESFKKEIGQLLPPGTNGKFIFSIGSFFERKNFQVLLPFVQRLQGYKLILAGQNENAYGHRIRQEIIELGIEDRVFMIGEIDDEEKNFYYQHCDAFVFPSISEGFGIPVIEAMQAGKPVFCSSYGSLPEVGGPYAFYWNNFEPERMTEYFLDKMKWFYANPDHGRKGLEYANSFTWQKAAEAYLNYYSELIK